MEKIDLATKLDILRLLNTRLSLKRYAELTGQSESQVMLKYPYLIMPEPTNDLVNEIAYWVQYQDVCRKLEYLTGGEFVCEGKPNQRKLLILDYFSKVDSATSLDVKERFNISLANATRRLRLYNKQCLLDRERLREKRRGRPTFVYNLNETGKKRLAYLYKTISLPRKATEISEKYRICHWGMQRIIDNLKKKLLKRVKSE